MKTKDQINIAVHLHLHYTDLLPDIIPYLKNIPVPFDLYVTITDQSSQGQVQQMCRKALPQAGVYVVPVENRGRDVKPFYTDLRDKILQYEFVCHIHGKKSLFNNGATKGWLEHLLTHLMGSKETVTSILEKLHDMRTGLIYPPTFPGLPYWAHNWLSNTGHALRLQSRLGIRQLPRNYFSYPIGNMFWAKVEAIKPLLDLKISPQEYPPENKQTDGEIMHALERMISIVSANSGFINLNVMADHGQPIRFSMADESIDYTAYDTNSLNNLKQAIGKAHIKVVSFDIFDTLVCRPLLDPDDMFDLMEAEVNVLVKQKVAFRELRRGADAAARNLLQADKDVTLDDIYKEIQKALKIDAETANKIKQLELDYETRMLTKRAAVVAVLEQAYALGKRVVLTSDMYLRENHLKKLLDNLGIKAYHKIYISADVGHRKDRRTLFPHLLKAEGVASHEVIHIGDNEHSDLQIPGDLGIVVFHVKRAKDLFLRSHLGKHVYRHRFDNIPTYYKACLSLAINRFYDNPFLESASPLRSDLELFGYYYFGPLLLSYVKWVADTAKSEGIKRLYFISRDGEILYKIYKLLQKNSTHKLPKAEYIEVSRRSLVIPFIKGYQDIDKALNANYFGDTLKNFFIARLGIDISGMNPQELLKYGFKTVDTPVHIPADLERIKPLAYQVYNENKGLLEKDRKRALRYLEEKGLLDKKKKAMVDIGYSGSMQRLLNNISSEPVHGLYMVTYNTIKTQIDRIDIFTKGLFGDNINPFSEKPFINKHSLFYEMVLSSVKGPVERYTVEDGEVKPVYEKVSAEEKGKIEKLPLIHKGIMDFCKEFNYRFNGFNLVDYTDTEILQEPLWHFIEYPVKEDILMLSGYTLDDHYCGNGIFYWVPDADALKNRSFELKRCLWQKAIDVLYPEEKPLTDASLASPLSVASMPDTPSLRSYGDFETPIDKEVFDWYMKEYEALPDWYKKIGHIVKVARGSKKMRIVLEDKNASTGGFKSKAEEIQAWYDKEYEVLPGWFKKFGHMIKILAGKKKIKDYL